MDRKRRCSIENKPTSRSETAVSPLVAVAEVISGVCSRPLELFTLSGCALGLYGAGPRDHSSHTRLRSLSASSHYTPPKYLPTKSFFQTGVIQTITSAVTCQRISRRLPKRSAQALHGVRTCKDDHVRPDHLFESLYVLCSISALLR